MSSRYQKFCLYCGHQHITSLATLFERPSYNVQTVILRYHLICILFSLACGLFPFCMFLLCDKTSKEISSDFSVLVVLTFEFVLVYFTKMSVCPKFLLYLTS